jgi:hypothetical protein
MKRTFAFLSTIIISTQLFAQQSKPQHTLQQSVDTAEIIFEGRDIRDDAVIGPGEKIYTVHYFLTLKWFKGLQSDTVKIITPGGNAQGNVTLVTDPDAPIFGAGFEYLLFCRREDVKRFGVSGGVYYYPLQDNNGFMLLGKAFKAENLRQRFFYDHLYKQNYPVTVFEPLAKAVGKNYQVVRPDVTDRFIEVKKHEEEQRKFVSDSIAKANGKGH